MCEYCKEKELHKNTIYFNTTVSLCNIKILNCPMCGRKLEVS